MKRPPYWNSTSGFDFGYTAAIDMLFCNRLQIFIKIGQFAEEIWRHINFSRWRPRWLNTTSGFVFVYATAFRKLMSIDKPNFVDISKFTADISLLPFLKNKRLPYWNSTSGFDLDHVAVICVQFCTRLSNFLQIGAPVARIWRHINF